MHLLAAMEHTRRRVLAQREVHGAPGEVPGLKPLLAPVDLAGAVVAADALQTHAEAAEFLLTFAEDACQVRTGSAPQVMAALRNLVVGVLCRAGQPRRRAPVSQPRPPPAPWPPLGSALG